MKTVLLGEKVDPNMESNGACYNFSFRHMHALQNTQIIFATVKLNFHCRYLGVASVPVGILIYVQL